MVGGLVGELEDYGFEGIKGKIINSYAIADLKGGYSISDNYSKIGGLAGLSLAGLIKSSYFSGDIEWVDNEVFGPIVARRHNRYFIEDCYYTFYMDEEDLYGPIAHVNRVFYISEDDLKSGEPLEGLETFFFEENKFPRLL